MVGSIGVSLAKTIPALLFWRFLQTLGAAPGHVVGVGVIGDIYKLEERGRAIGVFFAVSNHVYTSRTHIMFAESLLNRYPY